MPHLQSRDGGAGVVVVVVDVAGVAGVNVAIVMVSIADTPMPMKLLTKLARNDATKNGTI